MPGRYHLVTLGCPKNQVDSDKLEGTLGSSGYQPVDDPAAADVVVVNTCAFIEEARQESVDTILELAGARPAGSRLVVTGCMAERYGDELRQAMPEIDLVAPFGRALVEPADGALPPPGSPSGAGIDQPVTIGARAGVPDFDLLHLPRPPAAAPWAYVKVAEGCDRNCGFCAIPSFRGPQRSRTVADICAEVEALGVREVVLVAQDLASFGRDQGVGERAIVPLVEAVGEMADRVRLLYLYPSDLSDKLVDAICATGVPYFDLSLQHVSRPLLRRMRRWGDGSRFLNRIDSIRQREPDAAFRSNFIVGYPGETEADHDQLLDFVEAAQLDWCGFFPYSREEGTHAAGLDGAVPRALVQERLDELSELQDRITASRRNDLIGRRVEVLVDTPGQGRTHREAPEIDGVVTVPVHLPVGDLVQVVVTGATGPDLEAG